MPRRTHFFPPRALAAPCTNFISPMQQPPPECQGAKAAGAPVSDFSSAGSNVTGASRPVTTRNIGAKAGHHPLPLLR